MYQVCARQAGPYRRRGGDVQLASTNTLFVEMASNLIFLPTNFRLGWLATKLPTTLPPYRVSVMVE